VVFFSSSLTAAAVAATWAGWWGGNWFSAAAWDSANKPAVEVGRCGVGKTGRWGGSPPMGGVAWGNWNCPCWACESSEQFITTCQAGLQLWKQDKVRHVYLKIGTLKKFYADNGYRHWDESAETPGGCCPDKVSTIATYWLIPTPLCVNAGRDKLTPIIWLSSSAVTCFALSTALATCCCCCLEKF